MTETQNVSVNLVVVGKNSSNKNETNVGLKGVIMSASKRVVPVNKKKHWRVTGKLSAPGCGMELVQESIIGKLRTSGGKRRTVVDTKNC